MTDETDTASGDSGENSLVGYREAKTDLLESVFLLVAGAISVGLLHQSTGATPTVVVGRLFDLTITAGDLQTVLLVLMLWPVVAIVFIVLYVAMTRPLLDDYSEKERDQ